MSAIIRITESAARAVTSEEATPVPAGHMCRPCGTKSVLMRHAQQDAPAGHLLPVTAAVRQISSLRNGRIAAF